MSTTTGGGKKEFELLPEGLYNLKIDKVEIKMSEINPNCIMAKTELSVVDGEKKGLKIWDSYILQHQKEMPRKIGREIVDGLLKVVGAGGISSFNDDFTTLPKALTNQTVIGKVYVEKSKNPQYPNRNRVRFFKKNY